MASGKTTVGARLAEKIGWRFVDLDLEIELKEKRTISEIFRIEGEARFREVESQALAEILQHGSSPAVIALGGGTFIQHANRELMRDHGARTLYLEADFEVLFTRGCSQTGTRPLMQDQTRFRELFEERQPIYRSADAVVSVGQHSPEEIASQIAALVLQWQAIAAEPD